MRQLCWMTLLLVGASAWAQDAEEAPPPFTVASIDDVQRGLKDGVPIPEITAAIQSANTEFLPRHVYALIDAEAPEPVKRAMATKAALFYDPQFRPLAQIAAEARKFQKPQTFKLNDDSIVILFEFFTDMKNAIEAAQKAVGPLEPQRSGELEREYDQRKRDHDIALAKAAAPFEGQIDVATFELELAAAFEPADPNTGCTRAKLDLLLDQVDFFVFRTALGGLDNKTAVDVKSRTVKSLELRGDGKRRIEGISWDVCGSSASSVTSRGVKFVGTVSRTHKGLDWKGSGEFVDKSGNRIPATR